MAIFSREYLDEFFFNRNKSVKKKEKKYGTITKEEYNDCKSILKQVSSKYPIVKSLIKFDAAGIESYEEYLNYSFDSVRLALIDEENKVFIDDKEFDVLRAKMGYSSYDKFMKEYNTSINDICKCTNEKIDDKYENIYLSISRSECYVFDLVSKKA